MVPTRVLCVLHGCSFSAPFLFRFLVPRCKTAPGVSVHHSSGLQPRLHQHRGMGSNPGCAAGGRAQHGHGGLCSQPSPPVALSISTRRCHHTVQTPEPLVFLPDSLGSYRHLWRSRACSQQLSPLLTLTFRITTHPALCHHPSRSLCPLPELSFALGLCYMSKQPWHQHHPEPQQSDAVKPPGDEWGTCSDRVSLEIKR